MQFQRKALKTLTFDQNEQKKATTTVAKLWLLGRFHSIVCNIRDSILMASTDLMDIFLTKPYKKGHDNSGKTLALGPFSQHCL